MQISNLMCRTEFWNNLHQVRSKLKNDHNITLKQLTRAIFSQSVPYNKIRTLVTLDMLLLTENSLMPSNIAFADSFAGYLL